MNQIELDKEQKKLDEVLVIIKKLLEIENLELSDLYSNFIGNKEELWRIINQKKVHISNLDTSVNKPYFARIDFTSDEDGKTSTIYIGKNGITQDTNIIVTDWRAPISSLYYDSELGKCSYKAPEGIIDGKLLLKRQYEIEDGKLLSYFDVDLVSNDELLQKYLNSNNDSRLKSIVSTIQKEQNEVIRKTITDNLIVQGVAGSGKTTVALHRIAYLVYNYINSIKEKQYMVIGPNPVFLKYISSVLPELDVSGVNQYTYEDFVKQYINEKINVNSSDTKIDASINGKIKNDIDKFKCSIKYKDMLDKFLDTYFYNLTTNDLMIGDFKVLSNEQMKEFFNTSIPNYDTSFKNKIEITINRICNYLEHNREKIMSEYNKHIYELLNSNKSLNMEDMRKVVAKGRDEINKSCKNIVRKYFSKVKTDITSLYKLFISTIEDFDLYDYENLKILKKDTLTNIKKGLYDFEDLAALIHIKHKISPDKELKNIRHVVVDEAQDFGEFNFLTLKEALPNATFSIFGDLAQSIYDYRSVNNWDAVNDKMLNNTGKIINFNKSYRTTAEIMEVADDIAESIGLNRSDLVIRHGNKVNYKQITDLDKCLDYIIEKIKEYQAKGYKSIAIISKTKELSSKINNLLKEKGLEIPDVGINDDLNDEGMNICTISNSLAKGLEFDAVIITNADENLYNSNNQLDMKLLYIAVTRTLHELDIIYNETLTNTLLKNEKFTNVRRRS